MLLSSSLLKQEFKEGAKYTFQCGMNQMHFLFASHNFKNRVYNSGLSLKKCMISHVAVKQLYLDPASRHIYFMPCYFTSAGSFTKAKLAAGWRKKCAWKAILFNRSFPPALLACVCDKGYCDCCGSFRTALLFRYKNTEKFGPSISASNLLFTPSGNVDCIPRKAFPCLYIAYSVCMNVANC